MAKLIIEKDFDENTFHMSYVEGDYQFTCNDRDFFFVWKNNYSEQVARVVAKWYLDETGFVAMCANWLNNNKDKS